MAQTKRDRDLRFRIKTLVEQNPQINEKDLINLISGVCGISHRTASEHFRVIKTQQTLSEAGFKDEHVHQWSDAFSTPMGLRKECIVCHKTKSLEISQF